MFLLEHVVACIERFPPISSTSHIYVVGIVSSFVPSVPRRQTSVPESYLLDSISGNRSKRMAAYQSEETNRSVRPLLPLVHALLFLSEPTSFHFEWIDAATLARLPRDRRHRSSIDFQLDA